MYRRLLGSLVAVALTLSTTAALAGPAQAARPSVTIKTIPTQTVGYDELTTVKPRVSTSSVKVRSSTLTVSKNGKRIHSAKKSVKLAPGSFRVTTVVKYQVRKNGRLGTTQTKKRTQSLSVTKPRGCATKSDYAKVTTVEMYLEDDRIDAEDVDTAAQAARDLRSEGSEEVFVTLEDLRVAAEDAGEAELVAFIDDLYDIGYAPDDVWELRSYALCKRSARAEVTYIDGDAWFKEII